MSGVNLLFILMSLISSRESQRTGRRMDSLGKFEARRRWSNGEAGIFTGH